ncbi:hypothetical protein [Mycobacterium sp.]|uniref:hypothetical protein n=1 Tax=Mycobacterium sp. TaxID=1785 RepID=UPI0025F4888D|nr:hypothetical protein [Mycobacterium sp.]
MTDETPTDLTSFAEARWVARAGQHLAARVSAAGMTVTPEAAQTLVRQHRTTLAHQLGISEQAAQSYLEDDALNLSADRLVSTFDDEQPGADLFALDRSAAVGVDIFGRLIAGLAECLLHYTNASSLTDNERRDRMLEITQLLSVTGQIQAAQTDAEIACPPALLHRVARILTSVSELTDNDELSLALQRDATSARDSAC